MRKFLSLIALLLIAGATWNAVDARYTLGARKAHNEVSPGDIIAIQGISDNANNGYRFICGAKLQTALTPDCAFEVEEGPADIRTKEPTIFLRNIATNMYFGKNGLRGEVNNGQNDTRLVSTPDSAYNFVLYSCADSTEAWQGQHNFDERSTVFCYSYGEAPTDYKFICNWGLYGKEDIPIWKYKDTNCWDIYELIYSDDPAGDLSDLIEFYESLDLQFPAGSDPGFYPTELVKAYDDALAKAITAVALGEASYEEYVQLYDELKNAKEAVESAYINITDGYYYVVNALPGFYEKQSVEKAIYTGTSSTYLQWKDFDASDPSFVFKFTKLNSGNFNVQSFIDGRYWNASSTNANSQTINISASANNEQIFTSIGSGQWQIYNTFSTIKYHPASHSGGAGKSGSIVTWNTSGPNTESTWYLRYVPQAKIDSLQAILTQQELTNELTALYKEGLSLYNSLFVYKPDTLQPLITHVTDGDPDNCQLSSNASDPSEGQYLSYLIDKDPTTFWHSTYHAANDPQAYHYLQADISNNPQTYFQIYTMRRSGTYGNYDRPTKVNVYAAADTTGQWEGKADWKLVKVLDGMPTESSVNEYYSPGIQIDAPASYIRFEVIEKNYDESRYLNGYPYFNLAEFQIYPTVLDEEASQYYYVEGMQDAAAALLAQIEAAQAKVAENAATEEDIEAMTAAIEGVNSLYGDSTVLVNLIAQAKRYLNGAQVGTAMGNIKSQEAIDALNAAIDKANDAKPSGSRVDKATLDAACEALRANIKDYLHNVVVPDGEHWYYITSLDASRDDLDTAYTKGAYIYVEDYGKDKGVVWAHNADDIFTYNPFAMWRFIPVEDEDYPNTFYVQNLGSGLYMGDYPTYSQPILTSKEPVLYRFNLSGGQLGLIATKGINLSGWSIHAANKDNAIVGWSAGANTPSAWDFVEVDADYIGGILIAAKDNNIDVFAVPYEYNIMAFNDNVQTFAIKSMTLDKATDVTTIELYLKEDFAAGEPCILVTGDPSNEGSEEISLFLETPTQLTDTQIPTNGLVGLLTTEAIPNNAAWFTGKEITLHKDQPVTITAHTGYIDATLYEGAVEGVETDLVLEIEGLNWPATGNADVDGDGKIDVKDVVSVYDVITNGEDSDVDMTAADVNGDGTVNVADVVAIYEAIINGEGSDDVVASNAYPAAQTDVELYAFVGNAESKSEIPVSLYLTNPTVDVTAVEASLTAPVNVDKFIFDEDEDDWKMDNLDRWLKQHTATCAAGTALHGRNSFFISIAATNVKPFKETEGTVITVYFDGSELDEGDYEVTMFDALAVDTKVQSYPVEDMKAKFHVNADGSVTAIAGITVEEALKAGKTIYTVAGQAVSAPQKGQLYVIDGQVVKY